MSSTACDRIAARSALACSVLIAAMAGCGGGQRAGGAGEAPRRAGQASGTDDGEDEAQRADSAEQEGGPQDKAEQENMSVTGTKGVLEAQEIEAGVAPHAAALQRCYDAQLEQKKFVAGKLVLDVVVARTGQVGGARVARSDVGDWTVERCVLGVARKMTFARPRGGDGEAQFQLPLDFTGGGPALATWPQERIAAAVQDKRGQLDACAGSGGAPSVEVTLYVGNRGQVKAVGFASAGGQPVADAWADCAARAVSSWTLPDPKGKTVKASFRHGAEPR